MNNETKAYLAAQMVLMDAIEKGLTTASEAVEYMKTEAFINQAKNYLQNLESM